MPKVSQKHINIEVQKVIFGQFWNTIASINDPQTASHLFSDLLTETEEIMIVKRFAIALLLVRRKSSTEIHQILNVTHTTICSVAAWLNNAKPETRKLFLQLSKQKENEAINDKIEELFDKLPPRYGTNWWEFAKRKRKRSTNRSIHEALR